MWPRVKKARRLRMWNLSKKTIRRLEASRCRLMTGCLFLSSLFIEQRFEFIAHKSGFCSVRFCRTFIETKIVAKIAPLFFENALGLWFTTLVIRPFIVKCAIDAASQVCTTKRTDVISRRRRFDSDFFETPKTDLHFISFRPIGNRWADRLISDNWSFKVQKS